MRDHEFYRKEWMTEDQFLCFQMLCEIMGGGNHLCGTVKPYSRGIELNTRSFRAATFDFDGLTKAVILAHDRCIRFEICPSGPGMVKLVLFKRQREGRMFERHPTIEESIATHRETSHTSNHIPDVGKMIGWIKCGDVMPDRNRWVLTYDDAGVTKSYLCMHTGEWINEKGDELYTVTHWMPLPEAPNEDQ